MPYDWITVAQAAALVGCHRHTIDRHVQAGRIRRRYPRGRKAPTLSRASVEEFADWRRQKLAADQERRTSRFQGNGPPDDGDVWLNCPTAASLIGVSPQYLGRIAARGVLPAARPGARWWFRESDIRQFVEERSTLARDAAEGLYPGPAHATRRPRTSA